MSGSGRRAAGDQTEAALQMRLQKVIRGATLLAEEKEEFESKTAGG
jgi:hypothetical protein